MFDFDMLGLAPTLNAALKRSGFSDPTPIQNQAIPPAMEGHDILGLAQTGTGKTLAFGLPLIDGLLAAPGRPAPKTTSPAARRSRSGWSTRSPTACAR